MLLCLVPAHASGTVDSGACGDGLTWTLDGNGLLTVSGTGEMKSAPWKSQYKAKITSVKINKGATNIYNSAFYDCANLSSVSIPDSVTCIEAYAFAFCEKLKSVTIPNNVTRIEIGAFKF